MRTTDVHPTQARAPGESLSRWKLGNGWRPQRATALVIDHDLAARSELAGALEQAGYLVLEASNGFSGLRMVYQHRPELIVLEPELPEMSGLVMVRELKRDPATRHIPIIVVSLRAEQMREALGHLVEWVTSKPCDLAALAARVQALRRNAPASA